MLGNRIGFAHRFQHINGDSQNAVQVERIFEFQPREELGVEGTWSRTSDEPLGWLGFFGGSLNLT